MARCIESRVTGVNVYVKSCSMICWSISSSSVCMLRRRHPQLHFPLQLVAVSSGGRDSCAALPSSRRFSKNRDHLQSYHRMRRRRHRMRRTAGRLFHPQSCQPACVHCPSSPDAPGGESRSNIRFLTWRSPTAVCCVHGDDDARDADGEEDARAI